MIIKRFLVGFVGLALLMSVSPAAAQEAPSGRLTVVNAVENLDGDLYLDGSPTPAIAGFRYGTLTDPLVLDEGHHTVVLRAKTETAPTLQGSFDVAAGASLSLVAFKGATGAPRLVVFADEEAERPGQALLRFRQVAMAPEVDVFIDGLRVLRAVPNAENQGSAPSVVISPGARTISVVRSDNREVLVAPQRLELAGNGANSVYLIGSQDGPGSSLALVAENQSVAPQSAQAAAVAPPSGVPAGASGLLDLGMDDPRAVAKTVALTMVAAGALFLAFGTLSRHRRRVPDA